MSPLESFAQLREAGIGRRTDGQLERLPGVPHVPRHLDVRLLEPHGGLGG